MVRSNQEKRPVTAIVCCRCSSVLHTNSDRWPCSGPPTEWSETGTEPVLLLSLGEGARG